MKIMTRLLSVFLLSFILMGCEGIGMYVIGVASTASADYVTDNYINPQDPEIGTIFQLKNGKWMTNKGIILSEDDPRIPHLESGETNEIIMEPW